MRALLVLLLVCVTLAVCQAAVRRATSCVTYADCSGSCEDSTHHWSCIRGQCECHSHGGTTSAPATDNRPYKGTPCTVRDDCDNLHGCSSDRHHCYDGRCACYSTHHHQD
ncbi:uncharacterized protein [Argopecten irradians]|uniref:uncharacterized protein n=1 Tax=Argopecten irradians TaxID=31199 RepID=UPI00371514A0